MAALCMGSKTVSVSQKSEMGILNKNVMPPPPSPKIYMIFKNIYLTQGLASKAPLYIEEVGGVNPAKEK
jgi:hypothetical protein